VAVESADVSRVAIEGMIRPSAGVVALARAASRSGTGWRAAGLCLAASVLAVGVALGFPGGPKAEPPPVKEMPAKAVAKKDEPRDDGPKGDRITFAGRVVDPGGKPVKGAKVYLLRWGEMNPGPGADPLARVVDTSVKATTDPDGRYRFDVPAKEYPDRWWSSKPHLVAAAPGYGLGLLSARPAGNPDGTVTLAKDHPIPGRVINLEGKPVRGATVRVVRVQVPPAGDLAAFVRKAEAEGIDVNSFWTDGFFPQAVGNLIGRLEALPAATTDAQGRFELRGVGPERVATVLIEGEGIATDRFLVLTQPGERGIFPKAPLVSGKPTHQDLVFRTQIEYAAGPDQPFEGAVTDKETGKPIPGVVVQLPGRGQATTDKDGKYRLGGARPTRYAVYFRPPADLPYHGRGVTGGVPGNTRPVRLDVALVPAVWVTGRVTDERTRQPVAGATVNYHAAAANPRAATEPDPDLRVSAQVRTGPDGAFRLRGVAGKGWIDVHHPRPYVWACERPVQGDTADRTPVGLLKVAGTSIAGNMCNAVAAIDVDPAKPKDVIITLDPGVAASITLTDPDGKPLKGVVAYGVPRIGYQWTKPAAGDTVRAVAIDPDRPRPVLFLHPERGLGARFQPKPGDPGPWTVKLTPTATVTGRLVDADGQPAAGAAVWLHVKYPWQSDLAPPWDGPQARTKTDAAGRFTFTHVIGDADCVMRAFADRTVLGEFPVRAKPGETKDLGTIRAESPRE
jgi:protocatechuate 3,4-dioxygenase beta subunit